VLYASVLISLLVVVSQYGEVSAIKCYNCTTDGNTNTFCGDNFNINLMPQVNCPSGQGCTKTRFSYPGGFSLTRGCGGYTSQGDTCNGVTIVGGADNCYCYSKDLCNPALSVHTAWLTAPLVIIPSMLASVFYAY